MRPAYPIVGRAHAAVLFRGGPHADVDRDTFLRAASRASLALAAGDGPVVNLCADRLGFAVAFAAALLAGRPSVLGADRSPAGLHALRARLPGMIDVSDADPSLTVMPADRSGPVPEIWQLRSDRQAAIVLTSGSTGAPTAHSKCWGELVERTQAAALRFGMRDEGAPHGIVATVPPQHMYGFETSVLWPLHAAVSSWCGPALLPGDVRAALGRSAAPATLVTTPVHLRALLDNGVHMPARLGAVISAAAPLPLALATGVEAQWDVPVHEIFGATEVGSVASRRTREGDLWDMYPGVRLHMTAYGAEVTAPHAQSTCLADELDVCDGGTRFRLLGRRADVVKLHGKRASLPELTRVLAALPGVEDAAFVVPDDADAGLDARLVAFAVAPTVTSGALLAALRLRIDPVFLPRRVVLLDRLPRNAVGKLPRQALLDLAATSLVRDA